LGRLIQLEVGNYRSLREVAVGLRPLNVLAGANASGKSNLLDAIRFLGDAARDDLQQALDLRGGYERVRFRGPVKGGVTIGVQALVTRSSNRRVPDSYSLAFSQRRAPSGAATLVREERFRFRRTRERQREITISGGEVSITSTAAAPQEVEAAGASRGRAAARGGARQAATRQAAARGGGASPDGIGRLGIRRDALGLATLPKLSDAEGGEEVGKLADCFAGARFLDIDVEAARRPSPPAGAPLRADAANLAAFLHRLARDDESFASFERDAQAIVPGLIAIEFEGPGDQPGELAGGEPWDADGRAGGEGLDGGHGEDQGEGPGGGYGGGYAGVTVHLREMGLAGQSALADASHGTVRALALLAALHDPKPPALTCIEAFDHGLHPDAIAVLIERARTASERTQLLLTTHSTSLIDMLKPEELLLCERGEDGATRFPAPAPDRPDRTSPRGHRTGEGSQTSGDPSAPKARAAKAGAPEAGAPEAGAPKAAAPKRGASASKATAPKPAASKPAAPASKPTAPAPEPAASEPGASEPGTPKAARRRSAGRGASESRPADPGAAEPQSGEPQSGEPQSGEPQSGEPQAAEPRSAKRGPSGRRSPGRRAASSQSGGSTTDG
jgi:predicted ATPase